MSARAVLAVGAHPGDIERGCGATLWRHRRSGSRVVMLVMSNGGHGLSAYARRAAGRQAAGVLDAQLRWAGLAQGSLTGNARTVRAIEEVLLEVRPSIVYTHAEDDADPDRRVTASAVLAAARNLPTVVHFQGPSTNSFNPKAFVGLDAADVRTKLEALAKHDSRGVGGAGLDLDEVAATASYWGARVRMPHAEAFEVTRALFGVQPDGGVLAVPGVSRSPSDAASVPDPARGLAVGNRT